MSSQDQVLEQWCGQLLAALELEGTTVDIQQVLALAADAAHGVVRPAAPLTTFVVGLAAGLAVGSGQASEEVAVRSASAVASQLCRAFAANNAAAGSAAEDPAVATEESGE